jgi:hypothetical protein
MIKVTSTERVYLGIVPKVASMFLHSSGSESLIAVPKAINSDRYSLARGLDGAGDVSRIEVRDVNDVIGAPVLMYTGNIYSLAGSSWRDYSWVFNANTTDTIDETLEQYSSSAASSVVQLSDAIQQKVLSDMESSSFSYGSPTCVVTKGSYTYTGQKALKHYYAEIKISYLLPISLNSIRSQDNHHVVLAGRDSADLFNGRIATSSIGLKMTEESSVTDTSLCYSDLHLAVSEIAQTKPTWSCGLGARLALGSMKHV